MYVTHVYIQKVNHLKGAGEGWEENRKDHSMALVSMGQKEWAGTPSRNLYLLLPVDLCRGLLSSDAFFFCCCDKISHFSKSYSASDSDGDMPAKDNQQHHALQVFSK